VTTPVVDAVATHTRNNPAALACMDLDSGVRWTYGEFDRAINRVANWLVTRLGPASGARVATQARNRAETMILYLACVRAGAIFVPLNWRLSAAEVCQLLGDAAPSLFFFDVEFELADIDIDAWPLSDLLSLTQSCDEAAVEARRDFNDTSLLLYTSGTSGKPKGVMVTEANVFWSNVNFSLSNRVSCESVFLCDMPLFHTAGLVTNARAPLTAGGALLVSRGFDASKTLARIADAGLGITHYFSVPQMAQMLWNHQDFAPEKLRGLQVYATGGAPNPAAQIERFVNAGIPMSDGFGMTESGSNFGMPVANRQLLIDKAGSCGLPYLCLETRLVGDDGQPVAIGEPGELWVRGPCVSPGYWNQPELTAQAYTDGWFCTGDIARKDEDGFFYIVDRKKDMFISGGENVYPVEVEAAIAKLDAVAEVAVVGVPDDIWGERGVAFIVAATTLEVDTVHQHCESLLAKYKVPKEFVLVDSIPRTGSGKAIKPQLVEQAKQLEQIKNLSWVKGEGPVLQ